MKASRPESPQPPRETRESFGTLLRRYRLAAGLTQEALAERAGLSVHGLSALENGQRQTPYRDTVTRLASALGLPAAEAARLEAAVVRARAPVPASDPDGDPLSPERTSRPDRTNLPVPLTSFIGREREQGEVRALLDAGRLVTLTGAGGVGKTRLALAVAAALVGAYPEGVWLVELAPLADPALVMQTVATALGLREERQRPLLATLVDHLKRRHLLLVLDNCEHLVAACADLAVALLQGCSHLRIVATSRETLEAPGETVYRVPSLAVPDLAHLPHPAQLPAYAAVALFVQRARSRCPDFAVTARNAHAVAVVCARLDGMPLAIELAAARAGSVPVETIAARLDDRFRLLTGGSRTALPRQQTLRATLDWSYDLLSEAERVLLRRLSVFAGGWTLEAAEATCAGEGIVEEEVLDLLAGLVNKSLVSMEEGGAGSRYRLLETVRQYGRERMAGSGEAAIMRRAHALYYLKLAEAAEPDRMFMGPEQGRTFANLEQEHDNLRAALRWAHEQHESEIGLRLGGALALFWLVRDHLSEGRAWLDKLLLLAASDDAAGATTPRESYQAAAPGHAAAGTGAQVTALKSAHVQPPVRQRALARVLRGVGALTVGEGMRGPARSYLEDAIALFRALGDAAGLARALSLLGVALTIQGEFEHVSLLYEEALSLYQALGDRPGIARMRMILGETALLRGDVDGAESLLEESLALACELDDAWGMANARMDLGEVAYHRHAYARAVALYEAALAANRDVGGSFLAAQTLNRLGQVAQAQGDHAVARARQGEGLALAWAAGVISQVVASLEGVAAAVHGQGQPERAAQVLGAAQAAREARGIPRVPVDRPDYEALIAGLNAALGEVAFGAAWAEGRALPLEEAVALALAGHTTRG